MECIIGLVGGDYAMIAADMNAGRSIMVFNQEADRIMEMDSHKLLGVCGDPADCVNEPEFFQKNLNLYALRNAEKKLSTHATANYMRGEKSANLRKGMKQVDMLLCGFDEGKGPSLYFIDYLASMQKLNVAGHGYGGIRGVGDDQEAIAHPGLSGHCRRACPLGSLGLFQQLRNLARRVRG